MQSGYYGTIVEITSSGVYMVQGTLNQGFISISEVSEESLDITIILNGVDIVSKNYAALMNLKSNLTLVLAENTTNSLSDVGTKKQPNATLLSQSDLTIKGSGKLIVNGRRNNGIVSHANLKVEGGEIEVNAIKKALRSSGVITISGGTFNINSDNDGIHSDSILVVNNGTFNISSGDDAIRAKKRLTINGGTINITKCYEGLESYDIDLNGGFVKIKSSDDGINISGGRRVGDVEPIIDGVLTITGGEYYIEAEGDGVDSNGFIEMSGGRLVAFGPTSDSSTDRSIDFDQTFTMTGGSLLGLGYTIDKMKTPISSDSAQYAFLAAINAIPAGTLINVSSDLGKEVVTVKTLGSTRSLLVCSPLLGKGTYRISSGGSYSGSANAIGLYEGGTYSGGSVVKTFTISDVVTSL
jgi:hypothetical protein